MTRPQAMVLATFVALSAMPREAASAPDDKTTERLYTDARAAFDKGDYDRACPLFQEYYELSPVPAALFTVAECEARWGKPARALAHFETYVRMTADAPASPVQDQRARMAYEQIAKLSTLVGKVMPVLGPSVHGSVVVKLDGVPVTMPADHAVVVEPGEHVLELMTEDGMRQQKRFMVGTGEARRIELGGAPETASPTPTPPPRPKPEDGSGGRTLTTPVLVAGGVGVAGIALGTVFGVLALGKKSDVDAHCVQRTCDARGLEAVDHGQTMATVSTVGFTIGVVGVVSALVLYLAQPTTNAVAFDARGAGARF